MTTPAVLVLADGSVFKGTSIGVEGQTVGEVVFNTSMTGYQEILTDPSYRKQIVTLTYPHIGNTGTNPQDEESDNVFAAGLIIRDLSLLASNFRSTENLDEYLKRHNVIGIADIDTRRLTRILREKGVQAGCITTGESPDIAEAQAVAQAFNSTKNLDLVKEITCAKAYEWTEGSWVLGQGYQQNIEQSLHVVAYDFGLKRNFLRLLVDRGCRLTVVPATTSAEAVLAMNPDGIFLSNGAGDPEACDYAIDTVKNLIESKTPVFGLGLGHQLLGLATGAKTEKMKHGHHGANHPVQNLATGKVIISSQNHGFTISEENLPTNLEVTHRSLFDQSIQGIQLKDHAVFSYQGQPETSTSTDDVADLFDLFINNMQAK